MGELLWLHSGGAFNKEPEYDLGNYPSRFEISGGPPDVTNTMNNLFDDILPGLIDYRCFYIWNPNTLAAIEDISLELTQCEDCGSVIEHGTLFQDDIQQIEINCASEFPDVSTDPDVGGYVIFDTEFGAPFTVFYNGIWNDFANDLQARIREQHWCDLVTVTGLNPFTVTFTGGVGNRKVQLIRVVQNDLVKKGIGRLNTVTYFACDTYNGYGKSKVRTVQQISDHIPLAGDLRIYNPLTGLWDSYAYFNHDLFNFYLSTPLQFNLVGFLGSCPPTGDVNDSQNWQRWKPSPVINNQDTTNPPVTENKLAVPWGVVEAPVLDKNCLVNIIKVQEGSPINNIATPILHDTDVPTDVFFSALTYILGNLRPNEGFYWWIKRDTQTGPCLRDNFRIRLVATKVSWPLT